MVAGIVATLVTDIVLHKVGVFPSWGESMLGFDRALLLATTYRTVYQGSRPATSLQGSRRIGRRGARLGGRRRWGLAVSILGAAATWNQGPAFGPHWYPLALVVLAMPQAWGGRQTPRDAVAAR